MANEIEKGALYVVATPIGNLADISDRAKKVLSEVDFIAAEDTRVTGKLLAFLGVKKSLVSYHEHNKREKGEIIVERLLSGESGAVVSDAGTPAISDPGEDLVRLCAEKGIVTYSVPGPCAAVCALSVSGLSTSRFQFEGFLPVKKGERVKRLEEVKDSTATLIFYEAPHKLLQTLESLYEVLGDRKISLVREITKINEEVFRTTLERATKHYKENEPRGEFVLVVEGAREEDIDHFWYKLSVKEHVDYYISQGSDKKQAMKNAARDRNVSKSDIYKEYNGL